jgi:Ca2+-binding RTX toxin-like protein
VVVSAVMALTLALVGAPAGAAATCTFDAATGVAALAFDAANQEVKLTRAPDGTIRVEEKTSPATTYTVVTCSGGTPTVTTTQQVVVTGTAANNQDLRIDLTGGQFEPGPPPAEATGVSEVEISANLGEPVVLPPPADPPPADAGDGVIVVGSTGSDVFAIGANGVNLNGDDDVDVTIVGADEAVGDRQLLGGDGDDTLTAAGDAVTGAAAEATTLDGGNGVDMLTGGAKADTLNGGAGVDTMSGGADNDTLNGGAGIDVMNGEAGNDTMSGGPDSDTLNGDVGNDTVNGDAGIDTLNGGLGDDTLSGGIDNDTENGDAGNDTFDQGGGTGLPNGADVLNGGLDTDLVTYSTPSGGAPLHGRQRGVVVTLDATANDGEAGPPAEGDNVGADAQLENVVGTLNNDQLTGSVGTNLILGTNGNDTMNGGGGDDTLNGGPGDDIENGDAGNDTFDQEAAANGADVMSGAAGNDRADYSKRVNFVSVTADDVANDGEANERDNVRADVESATAAPTPHPGQAPATPAPGAIALLGHSDLGGQGLNGEVTLVGNTAVVATGYVPMNTQSNAHTKIAAVNVAPPCATIPVKVVDISDATRPRVVATIPVPQGQAARDVDALNVSTPSFNGHLLAIAFATCQYDQEALRNRGVAQSGSYADRGVAYYDISNPVQPRFLSRYMADFDNVDPSAGPCARPPGGGDARCAKDQYSVQLKVIRDGRVMSLSTKADAADVNSPSSDLRIVDVTDPANPVQVGSWPPVGEPPPRLSNNGCYPRSATRSAEFSLDGTKVFAPYLDGGLFVLAVLDLANPSKEGQWNYPADWNVEGNGAYVTHAEVDGRQFALLADEDWWWPTSAFRVSTPAALAGTHPGCSDLFTTFDLGFDAQIHRKPDGQVSGDLVYIGRGCPARRAADGTTTPADPYLTPTEDLTGKIAFADGETPNPPTQPGLPALGCTFASRIRRAQDNGAIALVLRTAGGTGGHVESIAGFPPVGMPREPADQAGAPTGDLSIPGFQIKKPIGDAIRSTLCPATAMPPGGSRVCTGGSPVSGTLVDLPGQWGGLRVIDVTNPRSPSQVAVYRTPNAQVFPPPDGDVPGGIYSVHHATVQGDRAYVAWNSDGFRVLDLKGGRPVEIFSFVPAARADPTGTVPAKAYVQGVAATRSRVVVSDINSGLYVFSTGFEEPGAPAAAPASVAAAPSDGQAGQPGGRIPTTGTAILKMLLVGVALLASGAALTTVARGRRRTVG